MPSARARFRTGYYPCADQEAGYGIRRRKRSQPAGPQREIAGGGKSLAPENLPEFPALAVMAVPGLRIQVRNKRTKIREARRAEG